MVGIERFCDRVVHLERGRITKAEHMTSHGDQGLVRANPVAL
jgi:hypothetical protein